MGPRSVAARADASSPGALTYTEGYIEVEEIKGCRVVLDSEATPQLEYLVAWKVRCLDTP